LETTLQEEMKANLFGVRKVNIQSQKTIANPLGHFGSLGFGYYLVIGAWKLVLFLIPGFSSRLRLFFFPLGPSPGRQSITPLPLFKGMISTFPAEAILPVNSTGPFRPPPSHPPIFPTKRRGK